MVNFLLIAYLKQCFLISPRHVCLLYVCQASLTIHVALLCTFHISWEGWRRARFGLWCCPSSSFLPLVVSPALRRDSYHGVADGCGGRCPRQYNERAAVARMHTFTSLNSPQSLTFSISFPLPFTSPNPLSL